MTVRGERRLARSDVYGDRLVDGGLAPASWWRCVEAFVRDRGKGFDPNALSNGRRGITDSGGIGTVLSDNTVDGNTW